MRNFLVGILLLFALSGHSYSQSADTQPSEDYLLATLEILVDTTLQAYNSEDYFKFFEYFAKEMSPITTKQYFKAVYVEGYKAKLGLLHFRELILEESSLDFDFPMLVYRAEFEKEDNVLIIVNFAQEHGNYRIKRIRFDRVLSPEEALE